MAIIVSPYGAFLGTGKLKKRTRGLHFTRGLRHHRYYCVALRALKLSKPSQLSKPSKPSKPT